MSLGISAAIPAPNNLITNGHVGSYTKWVAYLNPSTGVMEGMQKQIKLYNASGATLAGQCLRVAREATGALDPQVVDQTAQTVDQFYVIAPKVIADATWDWFIIEGPCQALVDGGTTDVAAGDYLKMTAATSATALTSDGTATLSADSIAIAVDANTGTAALKKVIMLDSTRHDSD